MSKRSLYLLVTTLCLALLGIIAVQFFWIRNAIQVKEAQFNRSVNDALNAVVMKLETRESIHLLSRANIKDSLAEILKDYPDMSPPPPDRPEADEEVQIHKVTIVDNRRQQRAIDSLMKKARTVKVNVNPLYAEMQFEWNENELQKIDSIMKKNQQDFTEPAFDYSVQEWHYSQGNGWEPGVYHRSGNQAGRKLLLKGHSIAPPIPPPPPPDYQNELMDKVSRLSEKTKKLKVVLQKLTMESETKTKSMTDRVPGDTLRQMLSKALTDKEIDLPFEFAVYSPSQDTNAFPVRSAGYISGSENMEHSVTLFPNDLTSKPSQLKVVFPGQTSAIFSSLSFLMMSSIIFTLVIVLSSAASIVVMIRQKKISDIKTDFINNMTHEFKTPIATISIAADSINNSRVISEPEKIRNFTRIIKEENNRMNARVEQVLQMALLDSRDFKLRPVLLDMHQMISRAADHYRLQIEKREGSLTMKLEATNPFVHADEDHLRNVLMNLLDNANKYSVARPEILIFSFNRGEKFYFGVEDRGVGMSSEAQRKVFEKFFRVTSGNIHNIKGFGLGLSYVKAIVLAHQGEIHLDSELGRGSRFEISLPYVPGKGEKVVYEGIL
jgi:two-component system phosphate regulon sensor histidine kinase PhoR